MNAFCKARNLRISPMKVRRIVRLVKGKKIEEALAILKLLPNKAAKMAYKAVYSAQANFKNKFPEAGTDNLSVLTVMVDQAPVLRRLMPRARGRADVLRKQSAHLTVVVGNAVKEER